MISSTLPTRLCLVVDCVFFFFFSSRRRHTRLVSDWSSDVCSSDLLVTSLSIFGFLRELSGHIGKAPGALMSLPTGEASTSLGTSGTGLVLPPSLQGKEWEESPKKKENQE